MSGMFLNKGCQLKAFVSSHPSESLLLRDSDRLWALKLAYEDAGKPLVGKHRSRGPWVGQRRDPLGHWWTPRRCLWASENRPMLQALRLCFVIRLPARLLLDYL